MMNSKHRANLNDEEMIFSSVLRLNTKVLSFCMGVIGGLIIFIATIWLVIKGGDPVGPHLSLLNQYFWGYQVSLWGAFVGFGYGFLCSAAAGILIGFIYNQVVNLKTKGRRQKRKS